MLKSAEIVLLVAKDKVAHQNFFTHNTRKKADKLIMWEEVVKGTKIVSNKLTFV